MLKRVNVLLNNVFLLLTLPLLSGCLGGGITSLGLGSLFGISGGSAVGELAFLSGNSAVQAIAQTHNPEPATMVLMGSGLAALTYYRKATKRKVKP